MSFSIKQGETNDFYIKDGDKTLGKIHLEGKILYIFFKKTKKIPEDLIRIERNLPPSSRPTVSINFGD
jgi:hypothetical protein